MKSFICVRIQRARGNIYRLRNELIGMRRRTGGHCGPARPLGVMTRKPELSVLFPKQERAIVLRTRSLAMAITLILREVVGMIGHVDAYISRVTIRLMVLATVSFSLMLAADDASRPAPPATPEHDVVENYHGRQVHDPYRWLEQAGPAVEQWIDAQNAYTDAVVSGFQDHGVIIKRVSQLALTSTQRSDPQIVANVLFYMRQTPPQPQAVL